MSTADLTELKGELHGGERRARKALRRLLENGAAGGHDLAVLLPDALPLGESADPEARRLLGLFVELVAQHDPEAAELAVPMLKRGAQGLHSDPLARARALRTLSAVRTQAGAAQAFGPVRAALADDDPFVRRTAAMAAAQVFATDAAACSKADVLPPLRRLLADPVASVVAAAAAARQECVRRLGGAGAGAGAAAGRPEGLGPLTASERLRLLAALGECQEWDQCSLLESLQEDPPGSVQEAVETIERTVPQLNASNSAVALASAGVVLTALAHVERAGAGQAGIDPAEVRKKLAEPFFAVASFPPDLQYAALRCARLLAQDHPEILRERIGVKAFFCKYNDPLFVKLEKVSLLMALAEEGCAEEVLVELEEYAQEVEVGFSQKAIRAIGQLAVKLPGAANACVNKLSVLVKRGVEHIVLESIVVIMDILRKYPNQYEGIAIPLLCDNVEDLANPRAKAAMIWLVGEYAERIEDADDLLEYFSDGFADETAPVQLATLTALAKLFLKVGEAPKSSALLQAVLRQATEECDNPDVRDRAMMYWRMLSQDAGLAAAVVLAPHPTPAGQTADRIDAALCSKLITQIPKASSVFYKLPGQFTTFRRVDAGSVPPSPYHSPMPSGTWDLLGEPTALAAPGTPPGRPRAAAPPPPPPAPAGGALDPLAALYELTVPVAPQPPAPAAPGPPAAAAPPAAVSANPFDTSELFRPFDKPVAAPQQLRVVLPFDRGQGLQVKASFSGQKRLQNVLYNVNLENRTPQTLASFMIQFNKNAHGCVPRTVALSVPPLAPGRAADVAVPVDFTGPVFGSGDGLQIALKAETQGVIHYFSDALPPAVFV